MKEKKRDIIESGSPGPPPPGGGDTPVKPPDEPKIFTGYNTSDDTPVKPPDADPKD